MPRVRLGLHRIHRGDGFFDEGANVAQQLRNGLAGFRRFFGQLLHFLRHDGKSPAVLPTFYIYHHNKKWMKKDQAVS
jgi:hypothetical protein